MKTLGLFALSLLVMAGCGKKEAKTTYEALTPDSAAVVYYKLRVDGKYAQYVAAMQSCDSTTADYKKQMETLLRHHAAVINKTKQGVKSVKALRTEMHDAEKMANVFLNITYNDGSDEEIILPLVLDDNTWRLQ